MPLHAVAFIAGSAVMVLEILGTRIIGPVTAMNALLPASVWLNTTVHDR